MRVALLVLFLAGCGRVPTPGPPPAPSDRYAQALARAGLDSTRLGRAWIDAQTAALEAPDTLGLPAVPGLDVAPGAVAAAGWRIGLRQGEQLAVEVVPSLDSARAFVDLFGADSVRLGGWEARTDTLRVTHRADRDQGVVLLVRAELLAEGTVGIRVQTDPSLTFPVAGVDDGAIRSRWGAPRDGGARRHEGIDVFAPRGTPVVAGAPGRVSRVQETPIGGRVVWLQSDLGSLYYAHLDRQSVAVGARVAAGDTLGTVGNTGNAASTPPHLHFGLYGRGGAVDPEPFVVGRRDAPRTQR